MSLSGNVECKTRRGNCLEGEVHRIDSDLELCVCKRCGQGWMRDVDAWTKLEESMTRLTKANQNLVASLDVLKASYQKLASSLATAYKSVQTK